MIRSDVFPTFTLYFNKIKRSMNEWSQSNLKHKQHKRQIPSDVDIKFSEDIKSFLGSSRIHKVDIELVSTSMMETNGLLTNDMNVVLMQSKLPFIILFADNRFTLMIIEENLADYTEDELTALFVHDALYAALTTTTNMRIKKMIYEMSRLTTIVDAGKLVSAANLCMLWVATSPYRNPYVNGKGVTGIDDTIISMLTDVEIDRYNSAVLKSPYSIDRGEYQVAMDREDYVTANYLATESVNIIMKKDAGYVFYLADLFDNDGFDFYYNQLQPFYLTKLSTKGNFMNESMSASNKKSADEDIWDLHVMMDNLTKTDVKNIQEIRYEIEKLTVYVSNIEDEDQKYYLLSRLERVERNILNVYKKYKKVETKEADMLRKYLHALNQMTEMLRERVHKVDPEPKRYGVWIEYPPGYSLN